MSAAIGAEPSASGLAERYGKRLDDRSLTAMIITSDAYAKALFKGVLTGLVEFSLEEAVDHFFRRVILPDIPVPEAKYERTLREAFEICKGLSARDQ